MDRRTFLKAVGVATPLVATSGIAAVCSEPREPSAPNDYCTLHAEGIASPLLVASWRYSRVQDITKEKDLFTGEVYEICWHAHGELRAHVVAPERLFDAFFARYGDGGACRAIDVELRHPFGYMPPYKFSRAVLMEVGQAAVCGDMRVTPISLLVAPHESLCMARYSSDAAVFQDLRKGHGLNWVSTYDGWSVEV